MIPYAESRPIVAFVATTDPKRAKAVRALVTRGVQFRRYAGMPQDDLGIWASPSGAQVAWFTDPDGNTLSLTELTRRTNKKKKGKR